MTSAEKKKVRRLLNCLKAGGKGSHLFHHETYELAVNERLMVYNFNERRGWEITAKGEALLNDTSLNDTSLFLFNNDENESYTQAAINLNAAIQKALSPIVEDYSQQGYRSRDIETVVHAAVTDVFIMKRLR